MAKKTFRGRTVAELDDIATRLSDAAKVAQAPIMDLMSAQGAAPYRILVGTLLSARTKDQTTARACQRLFERAPTLKDLAKLTQEEIAELIYPACYYNNKAKHLTQLSDAIDRLYNGEIPHTIDELVALPGVGRKTANLVLVLAFHLPALCVDTHVHRLNNWLGIVRTETPLQTEMALRKCLPERLWLKWNEIFVTFGQTRCKAIGARCEGCPIAHYCSHAKVAP